MRRTSDWRNASALRTKGNPDARREYAAALRLFEEIRGDAGNENVVKRADLAPLFKGLPGDQCQCEHMGYVVKGKVAFRSGDGEELFEAGDAYYVGPGHTPVLYAGTEVIEFSPTDKLNQTMEVVSKNMEAANASA